MANLKDRVNITFESFEDLVNDYRGNMSVADTHRMLSYMGWTYFQILRETMPALTLEQCFAIHLGDDDQSEAALLLVKQQNKSPMM